MNDKSFHITGGLQQIMTLDGYVIPLVVQVRLARLHIRPYTDTKWDSLSHLIFTAADEWDPTIMDHEFKEDEPWGDEGQPIKRDKSFSSFDDFGNYWHCIVVQYKDLFQQNDGSIDLDDLLITLHYLGVPILNKSYMFGENKSMVDISKQFNAKRHKCHTILSFHHVRECIASKMVGFYFILGESHQTNILCKDWGYSHSWTRLKALLFWTENTVDISV
jgi:hypothetical protein